MKATKYPKVLSSCPTFGKFHLGLNFLIAISKYACRHMLHDPAVYAKPDEFIPERFNGDEAEMAKANDLLFGFGRRTCPGQHFAEGTLFAIMSTVLATCDILPGLDEAGNEVLPKYQYTANGAITYVTVVYRFATSLLIAVTLVSLNLILCDSDRDLLKRLPCLPRCSLRSSNWNLHSLIYSILFLFLYLSSKYV